MGVAHDSLFRGHLGVKKTKDRIQTNLSWPGLNEDVTSFCRSCNVCQKTVARGSVPRALLVATFPLSCAAARPRSRRRTPAHCICSAAHCISIDSKTSYKIRAFNRKQAPHLRYDSIVLQIQGAIS